MFRRKRQERRLSMRPELYYGLPGGGYIGPVNSTNQTTVGNYQQLSSGGLYQLNARGQLQSGYAVTRSWPQQPRGELPMIAGTVIGTRGWRMVPFSNNLTPLTYSADEWGPLAAKEAGCLVQDHPIEMPPVLSCTCGIYAMKPPHWDTLAPPGLDFVIGQVHMWGRIIECGKGFRSEYAYPRCFYAFHEYPSEYNFRIAQLADAWGIDMVLQSVQDPSVE